MGYRGEAATAAPPHRPTRLQRRKVAERKADAGGLLGAAAAAGENESVAAASAKLDDGPAVVVVASVEEAEADAHAVAVLVFCIPGAAEPCTSLASGEVDLPVLST